MRSKMILILLVALVGASCTRGSGTRPVETNPASLPSTAPTSAPLLVAGCPADDRFSEDGTVMTADHEGSDADTLASISWVTEPACETFTFAFQTAEGAPATTPPDVRVEYLGASPVLRIHLDVDEAVLLDQLVETRLVSRLYVVQGLNGSMFVDLHLDAPAQARATVSRSPARLVVELQPGIVDRPITPAESDVAVVISPLPGATVDRTLMVSGYTRGSSSEVVLIVTADDDVIAEARAPGPGDLDSWEEFRAPLRLPPGNMTLFVGHSDETDGRLAGVTLKLTVR